MARRRQTSRRPVQHRRRESGHSRTPMWVWFALGFAIYVYAKTKGT